MPSSFFFNYDMKFCKAQLYFYLSFVETILVLRMGKPTKSVKSLRSNFQTIQ